jgi:hypothetical protein
MVNQTFYPCLGVLIAVHLMENIELSHENCICNVMTTMVLPYSSISKEISCKKDILVLVYPFYSAALVPRHFVFNFSKTEYFSKANEDI